MSTLYYLAYGSNLLPRRLQARVPQGRLIGSAQLPGYRVAFHKLSHDGSGKCDLIADDASEAWAAVYAMDLAGRRALDGFEGSGYVRREVEVDVDGTSFTCFCYFARRQATRPDLRPYEWYHALVAAGARHHRFPEAYLATIDAVPHQPDPDPERHARNWRLLEP